MSSGLTISPAFQEVTLAASQSSVLAAVTVSNGSDKEVVIEPLLGELALLAEDGSAVKQYVPREFVPQLAYAEIETKSVKIAPGSSSTVNVKVTNTSTLSPGGHYFAVVLPVKSASGQDQQVTPTVTSTVFLTKKGGEEYRLDLISAKAAKSVFFTAPELELRFHNSGNTHAVPYGKVIARDMLGREVFTGIVNADSKRVFPEQDQALSVQLKRSSYALPASSYTVSVNGRVLPGDVLYTAQVRTFVVQPLQLLVWGFVFGIVIGLGMHFWQSRAPHRPPHGFEKL